PTLRASRRFAQRYGLEVILPDCRPDLLRFEQGRLQVLDVKASDVLKASHKIQVAFYALLLRDLVERPVDLETGWIWLYQQPEPQAFSLGSTVAILESFFRDELPAILASTPHSAFWHLNHRCEWCELFEYCRDEAQETSSVSLLPDLTHGGRRFLRDGGIESLEKLVVSLERGNAQELLKDCGSLRGRARRLRNSALALLHRESLDHGGSSLRFPKGEHVRVVLNLQKEPVSGRTYAAGLLRSMGKDVYGQGAHLHLDLARNAPDCERVRRDFVTALHGELQALHDYNQGRAWREQKSLQVYAFD
ncbi:MAG: Dna2/Cas4 domain-containing protein, partial [Candidatus Eremiobacteraeota bacterium]|nr:Dna2/Cas4 domain-containing protein [Candidatus Eremiobacteraeota bacterium]